MFLSTHLPASAPRLGELDHHIARFEPRIGRLTSDYTIQGAVQIPAPVAAVTGPPVILQQPVPSAPMVMPAGPPMAVAPGMAVGPGISVAPGMAVGSGVAVAPGMAPMPGAFPAMPAAVAGQPGMILQGNSGVWPEPACGIGRTGTEYAAEQMEMAYANKSFEPQDFKPADDNPSRMYMCRELDGNWTLRSRYSIDRMGNEWRWHMAPEGYFYAVRLPN